MLCTIKRGYSIQLLPILSAYNFFLKKTKKSFIALQKLNSMTLWSFIILLAWREYVAFYLSILSVYSTRYMQNTASQIEGSIQIIFL